MGIGVHSFRVRGTGVGKLVTQKLALYSEDA